MADDINLYDYFGTMELVSVLVAAVAAFFVGFIWYSFLFSKPWAKGMGMDPEMKMSAGSMAKPMLLGLLGQLLTAYVLWFVIYAFIPEIWANHFALPGIENAEAFTYALYGAVFVWLGFFLPVGLNKLAWENSSGAVFFINLGHDLVRLLAMAFIIVYLGDISP